MTTTGLSSANATIDYLQLLTVQLRNQDPIDPVDQQGLVNDLTQFSILEGIEGLNASFSDLVSLQELTNGSSLVGKEVSYRDNESGFGSGLVSEIVRGAEGIEAIVDGRSVQLEQIIGVTDDSR